MLSRCFVLSASCRTTPGVMPRGAVTVRPFAVCGNGWRAAGAGDRSRCGTSPSGYINACKAHAALICVPAGALDCCCRCTLPCAACRYGCIEELLAHDRVAFDVAQCLAQLPKDMDKMCCSLAMRTGPGPPVGATSSSRTVASAAAAAAADPGAAEAPAKRPATSLSPTPMWQQRRGDSGCISPICYLGMNCLLD